MAPACTEVERYVVVLGKVLEGMTDDYRKLD